MLVGRFDVDIVYTAKLTAVSRPEAVEAVSDLGGVAVRHGQHPDPLTVAIV